MHATVPCLKVSYENQQGLLDQLNCQGLLGTGAGSSPKISEFTKLQRVHLLKVVRPCLENPEVLKTHKLCSIFTSRISYSS